MMISAIINCAPLKFLPWIIVNLINLIFSIFYLLSVSAFIENLFIAVFAFIWMTIVMVFAEALKIFDSEELQLNIAEEM